MGEYPPVAPSPLPHRWLDKTCREMTRDEIRHIVKQFGEGAYNAKRAGFDGVQIHAVHEGYLIDQFAIALFNRRTDEYGGSLENRLRFAKEIVEEIKQRCGTDFPVALRYSPKSFIKDFREGALPGEDFIEKGRDLEEGKQAARLLTDYGYDALDTDVGSYDSWWWSHPPMYQEKGLYRPFCRIMKETVDVPILCAGRMDDPDMALEAVEQGICDMIGLGRPLLADPDYVNKLRSEAIADIRPCISCQEGCMGRIQEYSMINCAVNPQAAKERVNAYQPILKAKKVMVVGGGPAGCEAARVLAVRGHRPELFEKTSRLGGNLIPGGAPDFKEDDLALVRWYETQMEKNEIPVHLNHEVNAQEVREGGFDAVILATGSSPKTFALGDEAHVHTAAEVLNGTCEVGEKTVIIGGGLVGCETALFLQEQGKRVTIIEAMKKILSVNGPLCHANQEMLERLIPYKGIEVITEARADRFADGKLSYRQGNEQKELCCDDVILAVGYKEEAGLYHQLEYEIPEIYLLGDAKNVSNIMYAIWDAFEVANHIL